MSSFSFKIGEAYVDLRVDDRQYHRQMAAAQASFDKFKGNLSRTSLGVSLGGFGRGFASAFAGIRATFSDLAKGARTAFAAIRDHGLPIATGLARGFAAAFGHVAAGVPSLVKGIVAGLGVLPQYWKYIAGFIANTPLSRAMKPAFDALKVGFAGLARGIATPFLVVGGLAAKGFTAAWARVGAPLAKVAVDFGSKFMSATRATGGALKDVFGGGAKWIGGWAVEWGKIGTAGVKKLRDGIVSIFSDRTAFGRFTRDTFAGFANAARMSWAAFTHAGQVAWKDVQKFGAAAGKAMGALGTAFRGAFANVGPLFSGLGRAAMVAFGPAIGRIGSGLAAVASTSAGLLGRAVSGMATAFGAVATRARSVLGAAASWIGDRLRTAGGMLGRALGAAGIGGMIGGVVTAAAGGFGLAAVAREAARAEQQAVMVRRLASSDEMAGGMLGMINRTALTGSMGLNKVFDLASMGARLGIADKDLQLFTRDMAQIGVVLSEIPIDEATTRMARLLAVFHLGTDQTMGLASALNKLDLSSTASARDILDITSRLSGYATTLGMTAPQALALATALKEANIPTETAGTSMGQILGRMGSTKDMAQFARIAGFTRKGWEKVLTEDPLQAIIAFERRLMALPPLARLQALDKVHLDGQRVRGTLLQLGTVLDKLDGYAADAADEFKSLNSIQSAAAMVADQLSSRWTRLLNNVQLAVRALGLGLMPIFKASVEAVTGLMRDLRLFVEGNRDVVEGWAKWIADGVGLVGVLVREWRTLRDMAANFLGGRWDYVVAVFERIYDYLAKMATFQWENVTGTLTSAWNKVYDYIAGLIDYLVGQLKNGLQSVLSGVKIMGIPLASPPDPWAVPVAPANPFAPKAGAAAAKPAERPVWDNAKMFAPAIGAPVRQRRQDAFWNRLFVAAAGQRFEQGMEQRQEEVDAAAARLAAQRGRIPPGAGAAGRWVVNPQGRRIFVPPGPARPAGFVGPPVPVRAGRLRAQAAAAGRRDAIRAANRRALDAARARFARQHPGVVAIREAKRRRSLLGLPFKFPKDEAMNLGGVAEGIGGVGRGLARLRGGLGGMDMKRWAFDLGLAGQKAQPKEVGDTIGKAVAAVLEPRMNVIVREIVNARKQVPRWQ